MVSNSHTKKILNLSKTKLPHNPLIFQTESFQLKDFKSINLLLPNKTLHTTDKMVVSVISPFFVLSQ